MPRALALPVPGCVKERPPASSVAACLESAHVALAVARPASICSSSIVVPRPSTDLPPLPLCPSPFARNCPTSVAKSDRSGSGLRHHRQAAASASRWLCLGPGPATVSSRLSPPSPRLALPRSVCPARLLTHGSFAAKYANICFPRPSEGSLTTVR